MTGMKRPKLAELEQIDTVPTLQTLDQYAKAYK